MRPQAEPDLAYRPVGAGRDEDSLIVSGLWSDLASLQRLELHVARHLAKRMH